MGFAQLADYSTRIKTEEPASLDVEEEKKEVQMTIARFSTGKIKSDNSDNNNSEISDKNGIERSGDVTIEMRRKIKSPSEIKNLRQEPPSPTGTKCKFESPLKLKSETRPTKGRMMKPTQLSSKMILSEMTGSLGKPGRSKTSKIASTKQKSSQLILMDMRNTLGEKAKKVKTQMRHQASSSMILADLRPRTQPSKLLGAKSGTSSGSTAFSPQHRFSTK